MNKNYYKRLSQKYFDATLSQRQERRLMRFLSGTEDPDFDEVKAVVGFFAAGRSANGLAVRRMDFRPWVYASAVAASLALVVGISLIVGNARRVSYSESLASMESTLTSIFSSGADVESELSTLLTQNK
jgi:hypothetical protein